MPDQHGPLLLHWPKGPDGSVPVALSGEERVSEPFRFVVHVEVSVGAGDSIDLRGLVDSECSIGLALATGGARWIHGLATEVEAVAGGPEGLRLQVVLEPHLALLRRRADCRIFQNQSAEALIGTLCDDLPGSFSVHLEASGAPRPLRVQYDESDLNLLQRILEDEGWVYVFVHEKGELECHVREGAATGAPCPGPRTISPRPSLAAGDFDDVVRDFSLTHRGLTRRVSLRVAAPDGTASETSHGSGGATDTWIAPAWPVVGWEGNTVTATAPDAGSRADAFESARTVLRVEGALRGLVPGGTVRVEGLPNALEADGTYFVWSTSISATRDGVDVVAELLPAGTSVAPPRRAVRRRAVGPQLAVVTGQNPDTGWTDDVGRIQVEFPWDSGDTGTCWIPVVQDLAGSGWGTRFLPRVGQTVVVDFIDGDPEQPLVVGAVHHPTATPGDYDAPERFGWRSSAGGPQNRGSEISIRDPFAADGDPEVLIRAQADLCVDVDRNLGARILGTTTVEAGADGSSTTLITVDDDGNVTSNVAGTLATEVSKDVSGKVAGNVAQKVSGNADLDVGGNTDLKVDGTLKIKADEIILDASKITLKGGDLTLNGSKLDASTTGDVSVSATGNVTVQATQNLTNEATMSLTNKAGLSLTNEAGTTLSQKANIMIESEAEAGQKVDTSGMLVLGGSMIELG